MRHFDLEFRRAIRPLLDAYGWKHDQGVIEEGDISYFYEHYESLWELERYLVTKTGKDLHLHSIPDSQEPSSPSTGELAPISLMHNWKLGVEGRGGWENDGAKRMPDGTIYIPGKGWTGEMVEPKVSIGGRSYIGVRGKGEFRLEVKDSADIALIRKVHIKLSPGETAFVEIPQNKRFSHIMVIAITDYTQDVYVEDIFLADSKKPDSS